MHSRLNKNNQPISDITKKRLMRANASIEEIAEDAETTVDFVLKIKEEFNL